MKEKVLHEYWQKGLTYTDFRSLLSQLHKVNKVTGPNQTPDLLAYSLLNEQRMNRIDKHGSIGAINSSEYQRRILAITEGWCGDSAQILPYMNKWAMAKGYDLRIVLRDENLELMDSFLTNGARAVPLFLILDDGGVLVERWGARPKILQDLVLQWKNDGLTKEEFVPKIHKWYSDDKGMTCIHEWEALSLGH